MNEIPKNPQSASIPQTAKVEQQPKTENVQQPSVQSVQIKEITEIPENPADRTTVKIDNLENDIRLFTANPELAQKAMEIAELAEKKYQAAGIEAPELKSLAVAKAFVEEFQK